MFERKTASEFKEYASGLHVPRDIGCLFVHHTAGLRRHWRGKSSLVGIHNYHKNVRGWWGIGYNFVVDCNEPDTIWMGRPLSRTGAHALIEPEASYLGPRWTRYSSAYPNIHGIGVCIPGSYNKDHVNPECYKTLAQTVAILCERFGIEDTHVGYHEEVKHTTCPGSHYNFPKRNEFVRMVEYYMGTGFGNATFQMNDDEPVPAHIIDGVAFIYRSDAVAIADKYNLSVVRESSDNGVPVRAFLQENSLPDPGFDPARKLITAHTPEHWSNVRLIINDVHAGRVWMMGGNGAALVDDIVTYSGWPESQLPVTDGGYVMLRDLEAAYPDKVVLSTEYWTLHRKVYLYLEGDDFCAAESMSSVEITPDPMEHT
ncbi:MAG: peptidoglycan recognition family protein [Candidatus Methanomethylophilaceae archaeon]